jgi:hypothetical protein
MPSILRTAALAASVICLSLSGPGPAGNAQQQPDRQQRPRRVTSAETQKPDAQTQEVDEGDVVRVETQLVSVPAVVTNNAGRPLTGLHAENFLLLKTAGSR